MNEIFIYLLVAAGSGAAWSIIQFMQRYLDPSNSTVNKISDFSWTKFFMTVTLNAAGSAIGLFVLNFAANVPASVPVAIVCGLFGEAGFKLLQSLKDNMFPNSPQAPPPQ